LHREAQKSLFSGKFVIIRVLLTWSRAFSRRLHEKSRQPRDFQKSPTNCQFPLSDTPAPVNQHRLETNRVLSKSPMIHPHLLIKQPNNMGWELIKDLPNEAFRRLTGVQEPTFEKMIAVLKEAQ